MALSQYIFYGVCYFITGVIPLYIYPRIKDLREDKDLKQSDVAKMLKTSQQQYSRYELGIQELPVHHAITLCDFYNTSLDYIFSRTNEKAPYPQKKN